MAEITQEAALAFAELVALRDRLADSVSRIVELPEPTRTLDYERYNRKSSEQRVFKHIHQSCVFHRENFVLANEIKIPYLIDGFFSMTTAKNPYGMYAVARSMLELSAFLHEIQSRLQGIPLTVNEKTWKPLGEKFFGLIVRARFATANPEYREALQADGLGLSRQKPFNIMGCIDGLAREPEHADAATRYAILCDFVHHNLGSSSLATSGSGEADAARFEGGGEFRSSTGPLTITRYHYPTEGKFERTLNDLTQHFLRDALSCVGWLNTTPGGPFPRDMVIAMTGNEFGMPHFPPGTGPT